VIAESARFDQTGLIYVLCLFILLCTFMSAICLLLYFRNNNCLKEFQTKLDAVEKKLLSQEYLFKCTDNPFRNQLDKDELRPVSKPFPPINPKFLKNIDMWLN
jgi:hypothetical protein